jgi:hypothetical protein
MHYQVLHTELRSRLTALSSAIRASCDQGLTDLPKHAENLVAGLLSEILGYRNIRSLNAGDRINFPGLDLADDERSTGFQVTATASLAKVKETLTTVVNHRLNEQYPNIKVIVLSERQSSYSQSAIDAVLAGRMQFRVSTDILDLRDLLRLATNASPVTLAKSIEVLNAYERGTLEGFASADFDPPSVTEEVQLNLVELYFPSTLYVADLLDKPKPRSDARKHLRGSAELKGVRLPADFEVFEGKLVTFHNLEQPANPFEGLYDAGTLTPLRSASFAGIDSDHERVFKSLLRFTLQQQLYKQRVHWKHEEKLFVFMPLTDDKLIRTEQWTDTRTDTRTVVLYKVSKRDPSKGGFRHLAFQVDFLSTDDGWFIAIRPDWYFTTHPNFRPSPIGADLLKGIKRLENNKAVEQHFRFLCYWMRAMSETDLLTAHPAFLTFGEAKAFSEHPALDDARWLPVKPAESAPASTDEFSDLLTPHEAPGN